MLGEVLVGAGCAGEKPGFPAAELRRLREIVETNQVGFREAWMGTLAVNADERVASVDFSQDYLVVGLKDGRRISVPMEWYPRLAHASQDQLEKWEVCAAGYGIHWPELDEDLSTEGLLRGAPAPDTARSERRQSR